MPGRACSGFVKESGCAAISRHQISIVPVTVVAAMIMAVTATVIAIVTATAIITIIAIPEYLVTDQAAQRGAAQCGQRVAVSQRITGATAQCGTADGTQVPIRVAGRAACQNVAHKRHKTVFFYHLRGHSTLSLWNNYGAIIIALFVLMASKCIEK